MPDPGIPSIPGVPGVPGTTDLLGHLTVPNVPITVPDMQGKLTIPDLIENLTIPQISVTLPNLWDNVTLPSTLPGSDYEYSSPVKPVTQPNEATDADNEDAPTGDPLLELNRG